MVAYGPDINEFFVWFNTKAPCMAERYFFLPAQKKWQQQTASQWSRDVVKAGRGQLGSTVGLRHPDIRAPCPFNTCYTSLHSASLAITHEVTFQPRSINATKQVSNSRLHLHLPRSFCVNKIIMAKDYSRNQS